MSAPISTNWPVRTNWIVITGAPCSGKTTLIDTLAARGYPIAPEGARAYIARRLAAGETITDIVADTHGLQNGILQENMRRHAALDPAARIFFDRGLPDSVGYFNLYDLDPAPALAAAQQYRYARVVLLEPLPLIHDAERVEDAATAAEIGRRIETAYVDLGYDLLRIPVMTIEERIDILLAALD